MNNTIENVQRSNNEEEELFSPGWRKKSQPTAGFRLLCHALALPIPSSKFVKINGHPYPVRGTLIESAALSVYALDHPDVGQIIVKIPNVKQSWPCVIADRKGYRRLYDIMPLRPYLVKPFLDLKVEKGGFAMERGVLLVSLLEMAVQEANDQTETDYIAVVDRFMRPHMLHLLHGIRTLHSHGWTHRDIRPANLLVVDGTTRLIDWEFSLPVNYNEDLTHDQGIHNPFSPDDDDVRVTNNDHVKRDFLGFGHTCICLGSSQINQNRCADNGDRRSYIGELLVANDEFLAMIGAKIVNDVLQSGCNPVSSATVDYWEEMLLSNRNL